MSAPETSSVETARPAEATGVLRDAPALRSREQTRARYPDAEGYVERDGVRSFYEVYGDGEPTILFLPTWSIVHSRCWKMQIPYLARHCRVVTFDGRGNGRSDRPREPAAYDEREFAADAVAVLPRVRVVLDRGNPSGDPAIGARQETLGDGMLKERVAGGGEQRPHVRAQLRHPARVAPVEVVGEGDEALEIAPAVDGRDLHCAQMTPSSFPSRPKVSSAKSN